MKKIFIAALALSGILWAANPNSINASNYKQLIKGWSDFNVYALGSMYFNNLKNCIKDGKSANCKIASTARYNNRLDIYGDNIKTIYSRGLTLWLTLGTTVTDLYRTKDFPWKPAQNQGKILNQHDISDIQWKGYNDWPISESDFRMMNMKLENYELKNSQAKSSTIKSYFMDFVGTGTINFAPGEYYIGGFTTSADTKMKFTNPGKATILHTNGYIYWNHSNTNSSSDRDKVAKGFILIHHGTQPVQIANDFYGTIVAPHAEVYINAGTKFYGTIIARHFYERARDLEMKYVKFAPSNF